MIEILNLRRSHTPELYDVIVDRRSVLGNRYRMGLGGRNRDNVCDAYAKWFKEMVVNRNDGVMAKLGHLQKLHKQFGTVRLFCWCAPQRCHAETIRDYLLGVLE